MDLLCKQRISHFVHLVLLFQILSLVYGAREPLVKPTSSRPLPAQTPRDDLLISDNIFLEKLLNEYGSDGLISVEQVYKLLRTIKASSRTGMHPESTESQGDLIGDKSESTKIPAVENSPSGGTSNNNADDQLCQYGDNCSTPECLSLEGIFRYHNVSPNSSANGTKLENMSPTILYHLQNPTCMHHLTHQMTAVKRKPTAAEVWGYGFICVTLINLCALMGMVFLPLMRKSFYQKMLMFMVALAVGTLTGSGLIFLIPESFEMTAPGSEHKDIYIWRCLTVVMGIYLFFLVERLLKMIIKRKQGPDEDKEMEDMPIASVPTHSVHREETINMSFKAVPASIQGGHDYQLKEDSSSAMLVQQAGDVSTVNGNSDAQVANGLNSNHGHSHGEHITSIKSVAWMVILGDGLHNFIDGLSIGAAFSGSVMTGISVSLAVICEELPHELGDFAILLNSGMSMRQALGYNFLSACMCYLGLVVGVLVGEATHGAVWIFAVAGGMFLYIALVDMLPEVNHAAEEEEANNGSTWSVFFIQNAGMLTGIMLMVLLAVFGGQIDFGYLDL